MHFYFFYIYFETYKGFLDLFKNILLYSWLSKYEKITQNDVKNIYLYNKYDILILHYHSKTFIR